MVLLDSFAGGRIFDNLQIDNQQIDNRKIDNLTNFWQITNNWYPDLFKNWLSHSFIMNEEIGNMMLLSLSSVRQG